MRSVFDLAGCPWTVSGYHPYEWHLRKSMETGIATSADVPPLAALVPGSVQEALRRAGLVPDWTVGLNALSCEWVENRHWLYETAIPDAWLANGRRFVLRCLGLDYSGHVCVNGEEVGQFCGTHAPHAFDLTAALKPAGNLLQIVFTCAPRWLGQFGFTSQMREWKTRFNYTWDWCPRLVQIGIWDGIVLEASSGPALEDLHCVTDFDMAAQRGVLRVAGAVSAPEGAVVRVRVQEGAREIRRVEIPAAQFGDGLVLAELPVAAWWPNGAGAQPLYDVHVELVAGVEVVDREQRTVGFKRVEWRACEGAPAGADPWLCVVNGTPVFLQGVNWVPIRANFADVPESEYRQRLEQYREMGLNVLRVWGGGVLEKTCFYALCDRLGILVWQEFPLSSSGWDNWPPEDEKSIREMTAIALTYIARRQHHVSLLLWCGGNELQGTIDGKKTGCGKPITCDHPMMAALAALVATEDATRRFLPTSSSGPRFVAVEKEFGQGLHWDVHGPWKPDGAVDGAWTSYWQNEDGLFRSETGAPGASPLDIIETYSGSCSPMPGTMANPLWRRYKWWIEWPQFEAEKGRAPQDMAEYVAWSQDRQARALSIAFRTYKAKFPRCGGMIFWMGHDAFPCMANTSIIDFLGRPKPAATALARWFKASMEELREA